ncbi:MAG: DEAD/DEAH box helicase family protein [Sandaracinaceae bacterium]|nr:DEAD/DEAH box helicase family protein [Sandaracinaceae bacterium]
MIDREAADALLDFGRRIGAGRRADEQLAGAVAIHNMLREHRVAYLADEVGMGKTYVALGALALFRHYKPDFRVLVIAPRENIQRKWQKELTNFAAHNVRFPDLRVASIDRAPARPLVDCGSLLHFVREVTLDPHRDFFLRMSSFSLALGRDSESWRKYREAIQTELPWVPDEAFDLRNKDRFKENFAAALCCAIPKFDLVIVDEAHNLKHGYGSAAARNRVLARMFGRADDVDAKAFKGYGPRADRVLFLSATPLEETYRHVWNQLDVFGLAEPFDELRRDDLGEDTKKEVARRFLVRRVTEMRIGGRTYTKNLYRREWRRGGVSEHDEPIHVTDPRQRLVVALVQKKVAELLGSERFNRSFQIGMLASFESFLETARLKRDAEEDSESTFDDAEQAENLVEREGLDVRDLNRLAQDYRQKFNAELPHPKMDAVVDSLAAAWTTGRKALVFVRRVASVTELKRKLDERYDAWLIPHLRARLPLELRGDFERVVSRYRSEKDDAASRRRAREARVDKGDDDVDRGGTDTFFAWYFRGEGPKGVVSGANVQQRFTRTSGALATFFSDNYVSALLGVRPDETFEALARAIDASDEEARSLLRQRAARYISRAKTVTSGMRFDAAQASGLELLKERACAPLADHARVVWEARYAASHRQKHADEAPDLSDALAQRSLFTELREAEWDELRTAIWPISLTRPDDTKTWAAQFREQELRAQLLAAAARLGHAFIDLYAVLMQRRESLSLRATEIDDDESDPSDAATRRIRDFLGLLDQQRRRPIGADRTWRAFDELADLAENFDLIVDVNVPDARTAPLTETVREAGRLLGRQQPNGGMSGQVSRTLVQQFRMPGYPMVLVTTDLLQEGEDLHTFCSTIHHYGISWTPSAMEQRIGRIDRVRSQTDRRLSKLDREPHGDELLQVHFPYLTDTVEVLQVERVLDRMNTFLRLMHEGLAVPKAEEKKIDVAREIISTRGQVERIRDQLHSAFPVREELTRGSVRHLVVDGSLAASIEARFASIARASALGGRPITWSEAVRENALLGTASLEGGRQQPFTLLLRSEAGRPIVRCISPVGRVEPDVAQEAIVARAAHVACRVAAILTKEERTYDLTVEDDVVLGDPEHDLVRVGLLVARVVDEADRFEQDHFDDGRDEPLATFERDLKKEGNDG